MSRKLEEAYKDAVDAFSARLGAADTGCQLVLEGWARWSCKYSGSPLQFKAKVPQGFEVLLSRNSSAACARPDTETVRASLENPCNQLGAMLGDLYKVPRQIGCHLCAAQLMAPHACPRLNEGYDPYPQVLGVISDGEKAVQEAFRLLEKDAEWLVNIICQVQTYEERITPPGAVLALISLLCIDPFHIAVQAHCVQLLVKDLQKHLPRVANALQLAARISSFVQDHQWFRTLLQADSVLPFRTSHTSQVGVARWISCEAIQNTSGHA